MIKSQKSVFFSIALGLFLLVSSSCKKPPKATVSWAFFDFPYSYDLTSVKIQSADNWHIVGGNDWSTGIYAHITNGESLQVDSIAPKRLNAISLDDDANIYSVGYTGYLMTRSTSSNNWVTNHLFDNLNILRAVDFLNDSTGLAVSGVAYHEGFIFRMGKHQDIVQIDSVGASLRGVSYISPTTAIAVGLGVIYRMDNNQWSRLTDFGDFYVGVNFPSEKIGYIVGNAGNILKTTDSGLTWSSLHKESVYSKNHAFRALHFTDIDTGYITGEHGLLWKTTDGGESWIAAQGLPDLEFHDVDVLGDIGILVGKGGNIVTFDPSF